MDELAMAKSYEKEKWGPPSKHERYSRIKNKDQFDYNFDSSELGKDVDPKKARRFHKNYGVWELPR